LIKNLPLKVEKNVKILLDLLARVSAPEIDRCLNEQGTITIVAITTRARNLGYREHAK